MVQSSRSRALIALISGCDAPYNRCKCIPGGDGTSTTSKISARHRSHLPDHSNAQPGSPHQRPAMDDGAVIEVSCVAGCTVWAVFGCTIVACAHTVVAVPKTQPQPDLGVVHTSRTGLASTACRCTITKKR